MAKTRAAPDTDNQDIQSAPQPQVRATAEVKPTQGLSSLSFPIEGESKWVSVMRALAFGTLASIMAIAAVFHFLAGDGSFVGNQQLGMMMAGIVFLLVLEYFVFLKIVIPRQANYGRYVISQNKVEYFPLTALGLGMRKNAEGTPMNRFLGVTTSRAADRKGGVSYAVFLVHSGDKGKTIKVQSFSEPGQAEAFAAHLGSMLQLNVASGLVKKKQRRAL